MEDCSWYLKVRWMVGALDVSIVGERIWGRRMSRGACLRKAKTGMILSLLNAYVLIYLGPVGCFYFQTGGRRFYRRG